MLKRLSTPSDFHIPLPEPVTSTLQLPYTQRSNSGHLGYSKKKKQQNTALTMRYSLFRDITQRWGWYLPTFRHNLSVPYSWVLFTLCRKPGITLSDPITCYLWARGDVARCFRGSTLCRHHSRIFHLCQKRSLRLQPINVLPTVYVFEIGITLPGRSEGSRAAAMP